MKKRSHFIIKYLIFPMLLLGLFFTTGCNAFREFFSRSPEAPSNYKKSPARKRSSSSRSRDPIRDMFEIKDKPEYFHDKNLTPRERELLRQELHSNDPETWRDNIETSYKEQQKKRQEWVFGR
jgi:hypothetical protein